MKVRISSIIAVGTLIGSSAAICHAAIANVDTLAPLSQGATINQPFTVTGGNLIVVELGYVGAQSGFGGGTGTTPFTLSYGSQSLTKLATSGSADTVAATAIYYGFTPTAGTANISGTLPNPSSISLAAYTFSGVDTATSPLVATNNSANISVSSESATLTGITAGSLLVADGFTRAAGPSVITLSATPASTAFSSFGASPTAAYGYALGLQAGSQTVTDTTSAAGKSSLIAGSFAAAVPEPTSLALIGLAGFGLRRRQSVKA